MELFICKESEDNGSQHFSGYLTFTEAFKNGFCQ
ncbi:hypothetical protein SLEP1_g20125 [Rubroshorea leprosula]|uniref:Uncharacterized protein n=1 Tax=Rubroshorea leprosula TaxID=152421 RepID=A0AAV5JAN5_9ROSI|nr:hypothetical protein SLEP1_g20125 [Rubroshorea leprosula]